MNTFEHLGVGEELLMAIKDLGFEKPSEIQEKAIPVLLDRDTDVVALAQTGTGKTAAFGFPLIQKTDIQTKKTQALILSPTRELCLQIANELKLYSKYIPQLHVAAIYGGAAIEQQAREVKRGAQLIVATPGRMQDMIRRKMVDISQIQYCVLDEADEMLNMGFYEDITDILSHTPDAKKTWLFSATMPREVAAIAKKFMDNPHEITVGTRNSGASNVNHEYYLVHTRDRYLALKRLADRHPDIFSVVFCRTKRDTQHIADRLIEDGYNAAALHGDLSQNQRDTVMKSFRTKKIQLLVATDVAARGIDVDNVTHVINYQLPDDIETYTHRSGRTGRAGKMGTSIVIAVNNEMGKIRAIERIIKKKFDKKDVPSGMEICEKQLFHLVNRFKEVHVDDAIYPYLDKIYKELEGFDKEELIKHVVSVEFNRFLSYYKNARDLNVSSRDYSHHNGMQRMFINLGSKDGLDWMSLKDLLKKESRLGRDDVSGVEVMNSFSFFSLAEEHVLKVLDTFQNFHYGERRINVEKSERKKHGRKRTFHGRKRNDSYQKNGKRRSYFRGK